MDMERVAAGLHFVLMGVELARSAASSCAARVAK